MMSVFLSLILATTQDGVAAWNKVGPARLERGLPQTVPFKYYTRFTYGFGMMPEEDAGSEEEENEKNPVWWDAKVGEAKVGAPRHPGKVDLAKAPRAAWGMMWWGRKLQQFDWREHAEEFIELSLAAPKVGAYHASTCTIDPLVWGKEGSLEADAEVATWYLRWLKDWPNDEFAEEMRERISQALEACDARQKELDAELAKPKPIVVSGELDTILPRRALRFLAELSTSKSFGQLSSRAKLVILRSLKGTVSPYGYLEDSSDFGRLLGLHLSLRKTGLSSEAQIAGYADSISRRQELSHRSGSEIDDFGGFDGVVNDAPLALLRAGALLNRKDLMERGVAALRAPLNQYSDPSLSTNGIKVPNTVRLGSMALLDPEGRFNIPGDWTFERYEGQMLANFAEVEAEFGGYFVHASGWAVGIDGCKATPKGPVSVLSSNPFPYSGEHTVDIVRQGAPRKTADVIVLPSICRMVLENGKLIAVPGAMKNRTKPTLTGTFSMAGSTWTRKAKIGPKGFECDWPKNKKSAVFTFKGKINGMPVSFGPVRISGV